MTFLDRLRNLFGAGPRSHPTRIPVIHGLLDVHVVQHHLAVFGGSGLPLPLVG